MNNECGSLSCFFSNCLFSYHILPEQNFRKGELLLFQLTCKNCPDNLLWFSLTRDSGRIYKR